MLSCSLHKHGHVVLFQTLEAFAQSLVQTQLKKAKQQKNETLCSLEGVCMDGARTRIPWRLAPLSAQATEWLLLQ